MYLITAIYVTDTHSSNTCARHAYCVIHVGNDNSSSSYFVANLTEQTTMMSTTSAKCYDFPRNFRKIPSKNVYVVPLLPGANTPIKPSQTIITTRVRSTREGNVLTRVRLSVHTGGRGGVPASSLMWSTPLS